MFSMTTAESVMVSQLLLLIVGVLFLMEMRKIRLHIEKMIKT